MNITKVFSGNSQYFPRALTDLRAGRLGEQKIVVTGGRDESNNLRREVSNWALGISCLLFQVLQYNVEAGTWTEIGNLETGRYDHAIADFCPPGNDLNPIRISPILLSPNSYLPSQVPQLTWFQ